MHKHYIVLSSSYSLGERIALDYVDITVEQAKRIVDLFDRIKHECGEGIAVSLHSVETEHSGWDSAVANDAYFKKVRLIEDEEVFISLIKDDRQLSGLDVAKYILSTQIECTHLKLEKLVYLCYADYLCGTEGKKKLFVDDIYAYRYGPVIKSVYERYKIYGGEAIVAEQEYEERVIHARKYILSARSRILFSEEGLLKIASIMKTIKKYGDLSAGQLVDVTHKKGSPWSHCDSAKTNNCISDEKILKYHCVEEIKNS